MMTIPRMILLFSLVFPALRAHGVEYVTVQDGLTGIRAVYADGSPLAYVDVTVFSPADDETEFQSGIADKNGVFVFKPDQDGTWTIIFDDGLGHGLRAEMEIQKGQVVTPVLTGAVPRWQKVLAGVSLIFGITGFLYGLTVKRQANI